MNIQVTQAIEPDPEPAGSEVTKLALFYKRAYALSDDLSLSERPVAKAGTSLWGSVADLAAAVMHEPPGSIEDVMLQISVASSWCEQVIDTLGEGTMAHNLGLAIESALQNATRFLCDTQEDAAIEGDALALLNELYGDAVRGGAEVRGHAQ